MYETMALEIKVIPTLTGEDAVRFVNNAESVSNGRERIDFSAQIADARAILKNARLNELFTRQLSVIKSVRNDSGQLR